MLLEDAFARAVKSDDFELVESFLRDGANPNIVFSDSKTALIYAIENGSDSMIELLERYGAFVNQNYGTRFTPLLLASELREPQRSRVVLTLLTMGADPTEKGILREFVKDDSLRILDVFLSNYKFWDRIVYGALSVAESDGQKKASSLINRHLAQGLPMA